MGSISRLNGTQDSSFNNSSSDEDESDQSTEIEQRAQQILEQEQAKDIHFYAENFHSVY